MLQVDNQSKFAPSISVFPDENGIDTLYVVVRATYAIASDITLLPEQAPPQLEDVFWGEPGKSSVKYASEMHLEKPTTDIVLIGHAYAPKGKRVSQMDCGIKVGDYFKKVRVFGNRSWNGKQMSEPEPFERMPLTYENAFGGAYSVQEKNGAGELVQKEIQYEFNPVGKGFCGKGQVVTGPVELPNLEDPADLIKTPGDHPRPAGFGFIAPMWKPRLDFAGTYDDQWLKTRAPYLPADFSNKFFNAASDGLVCNEHQQGDEEVILIGVCPDGPIKFTLPGVLPRCAVSVADQIRKPAFSLETLFFEPDEYRFSMTWRAALRCDKESLKIQAVRITEGHRQTE